MLSQLTMIGIWLILNEIHQIQEGFWMTTLEALLTKKQ